MGRGTAGHARTKGRGPLHLVSAWASWQLLVLGQEAVEAKSNEIAAIPLLLKNLELTGALVTIDAIGTQVDIARAITEGGGDYLLALKANRPALPADVETFFADPANLAACRSYDTATATMAASSSAATASPMTSDGWCPTAATPTNGYSPASPPSPWSRPRPPTTPG